MDAELEDEEQELPPPAGEDSGTEEAELPAGEEAPTEETPPTDQPGNAQGSEQSAVIESVTTAVVKALYSKPETVQGVLKMVAQAPRPEIGIARATVMLIEMIKSKMRGMDPRIAAASGPDVIGEIMRLALAAKIIPPEHAKAIAQRAAHLTVSAMRGEDHKQQQGGAAAGPQQQPPQQTQQQQPPQPGAQPQQGGLVNTAMGGM